MALMDSGNKCVADAVLRGDHASVVLRSFLVNCRDLENLLDAYLDRELEPAESASVRGHVASCVACREQLADRESLGRQVRRAPYYPTPDALRARLPRSRPRSSWTSPWLPWAAAAILMVAVAGSALIMRGSPPARTLNPVDSLSEAVVDSHVRALMGAHLFDVRSTDQHTVKPWFLGKVDFSPPVEDLAAIGFPLTGGRLDYIAGRPAAALVYARSQHTINLFVWPEEPTGAGSMNGRSIRGFRVRHWTRGGLSFWAVSDLNDVELEQFTGALQR
jgi:anti-sigma factor RsiW